MDHAYYQEIVLGLKIGNAFAFFETLSKRIFDSHESAPQEIKNETWLKHEYQSPFNFMDLIIPRCLKVE